MNKIILIFLTFVTFMTSGQNHFVGIKGSVNWTTRTPSYISNTAGPFITGFITGFAGGMTYEYLFKKHFSLSSDIIYANQELKTK